jgi:AraC-like DNA-binding protein
VSEFAFIELQTPPLPYYLESGRSDFRVGERHPNRRNFGQYDLLIVAGGELFIGENGKEWALSEGEALLLRPDAYHYAVKPCERETSFYWVHFDHPAGREDAVAVASQATGPIRTPHPFANRYTLRIPQHIRLSDAGAAIDLLQQLLALPVGDSFWEEQRLLSRLLAMLEEDALGGTASPATRLAEKAATYIQRNYRSEITNEILAEALHFHPNYIVRCMKTKYGRTPSHYLLEYRLERSKRLLVSTEWPIGRVAEEVGFRNAPYFSACFKRRVGMSPLRFRKQYLN